MIANSWPLQDAKNKFSQVVNEALANGPQIVTRRGSETVVVLSYEEYRRLRAAQMGMVDFFRTSPLVGEALDFGRDRSAVRDEFVVGE